MIKNLIHSRIELELLRKKGIIRGIITSENVSLIKWRVKKLKLDISETKCTDKASALKKICTDKNTFGNNYFRINLVK